LSTGADYFDGFTTAVTSYDYDAPLTEAGDITSKYLAIRKFSSQVSHGNQEPLMVTDKVRRPPPPVILGSASPRNVIFYLQCSDTDGWATGRASSKYMDTDNGSGL